MLSCELSQNRVHVTVSQWCTVGTQILGTGILTGDPWMPIPGGPISPGAPWRPGSPLSPYEGYKAFS